MTRHRTSSRGVVLLLLTLCGLAAVSASAGAAAKPAPIVFPVLGPVSYIDDFGAPRGSSRHEATDIMAPRRAPALAAEAGKVTFWTTSANAGCMLYLYGDSGTTYYYIHLNNDRGAGNDNKGKCVAGTAYAPGLASGDRVEAGQPVGFVGDSGDADGISPHLHFEVHPKGGKAVNPYKRLQAAQRLLFWEPDGRPFSLVLDGTVTAVGDGTVTLQVASLRQWPSHQHQPKLDRALTLTVPIDAPLATARPLPSQVKPTLGASASVGDRIRAWVAPTPTTPEARAGLDGALTVSRLLVR